MRNVIYVATVGLFGLLNACGGGADVAVTGSADTENVAPDTSTRAPSGSLRVQRRGGAGGARVTLEPTLTSEDTFEVRVLVKEVPDLYGIASHLVWDAGSLELVESKGHVMLTDTGYEGRVMVALAEPGRLILGAARFRAGGSPWSAIEGAAVGKQLWATLKFRHKNPKKSADIRFDPAKTMAKSSEYKDLALTWGWLDVTGAEVQP